MKKLFFIAITATGMLFACNSNEATDSVSATDDVTTTTKDATQDATPVATPPADSTETEVKSEQPAEPLKM